jgi:YVTN family beta-propeller protein
MRSGRTSLLLALWIVLTSCAATLAAPPEPAKSRQKLYITNSQGDDITVVDVATNEILRKIKVGPHPHGIAVPASQKVIYVTIEDANPGQLVAIDPVTDTITQRVEIGPRPNQLAVTPDGSTLFIPVDNGTYEVVDATGPVPKVVDKIHTGGRPHNTLCSADGKRMYLAPMAKSGKDNPRAVTIVDVASRKVIGKIDFSDAVRPIALSLDEKRFYANIDNLIGIEVADIPSRKMIHRIAANLSEEQKGVKSRSHGIGIRPDQKELWTCDVHNHQVYVYDLTSDIPRQIATIPMGDEVYWLTFTPDGKICYVSVRGTNRVAAVDTTTKKILTRIPSGEIPKRLIVVTLPESRAGRLR